MAHKFYDLLGVPRGASKEDLKRAYKKAAIQNHPDKGGNPEVFKEVNNAYAVLSDETARGRYDQLGDEGWAATNGGQEGSGGGEGMDPSAFFQQFFGGGVPFGHDGFFQFFNGGPARGPRKRPDHVHNLSVSLRECYTGGHRTLKTQLQKHCFTCLCTCDACQGLGFIVNVVRHGIMTRQMQQPCGTCNGRGKRARGSAGCGTCSGSGTYKEEKRIEFSIARGITSGAHMVFEGLGEQAQSQDERPGNLIIKVNVTESDAEAGLTREGDLLVHTRDVRWVDSVCGTAFCITHFDGPLPVDTAKWGVLEPGRRYMIPGKGMPKKDGGTGDLAIVFKTVFPARLSDELCKTLRPLLEGVAS